MKAKKYNMGGMMPKGGPMPRKKKPGQPAPYDDSGVPLGGPKGPKPMPGGDPMPSGGPKDSVIVDPAKKKKRAPMRSGSRQWRCYAYDEKGRQGSWLRYG